MFFLPIHLLLLIGCSWAHNFRVHSPPPPPPSSGSFYFHFGLESKSADLWLITNRRRQEEARWMRVRSEAIEETVKQTVHSTTLNAIRAEKYADLWAGAIQAMMKETKTRRRRRRRRRGATRVPLFSSYLIGRRRSKKRPPIGPSRPGGGNETKEGWSNYTHIFV